MTADPPAGTVEYAPPGTLSRFYVVDEHDPEAPRVVLAYHGQHGVIRPGMTVEYHNPAMPGLGSPDEDGKPLVVDELIDLGEPGEAPLAIYNGRFDSSAANLRPVIPAGDEAADPAADRPASPGEAVYAAVEVLYAARHRLAPDALRSLADIYVCAASARYHAPHEAFWEDADWAGHDTAECEADDQPVTMDELMQAAGLGHEAVPLRGSVRDQGGPIGEPVTSDHMLLDARYPLAGQCGQCHQPVQRTGPDAAWEHAGPQEGQ